MKEEYISLGKNVDIAIENGLAVIGKSKDDVDIKILETGGLFKKAKVALYYDKVIVEKVDKKPEVVKEAPVEDVKVVEDQEISPIKEEVTEIAKSETREDGSDEIKTETDKSVNTEKVEVEEKIIDSSRLEARITEFLNGLIAKFNIEATVSFTKEKNELHFSINGKNVGALIGFKGDTLNAIQYLLGNLKESGEGKIRVYLDIEGYKAKREEIVVALANKMADKAVEIERNVHLDPMTPYERRIVHTTLQDRPLVETESTGEGEKRHVVIKYIG